MSYNWTDWQDHVTEFEDRYTESRNDDGTITHTPVEGEILQQGTPQSAKNFNHMEDGITNASELSALLAIEVIHQRQHTENLSGDVLEVELTNSMEYPFNNSVKTVSLAQERNHADYTVAAEVVEYSGGFPGEILISAKLLNGFKVASTGSAKSVKVKLYVKGGFY